MKRRVPVFLSLTSIKYSSMTEVVSHSNVFLNFGLQNSMRCFKEWCRRWMIPLNWAVSVVCLTLPENNRQGRQAKFLMGTWFIKGEYALGHENWKWRCGKCLCRSKKIRGANNDYSRMWEKQFGQWEPWTTFFFRQSLVQSKAVVISCATVVSRFRCLCRSHFTD